MKRAMSEHYRRHRKRRRAVHIGIVIGNFIVLGGYGWLLARDVELAVWPPVTVCIIGFAIATVAFGNQVVSERGTGKWTQHEPVSWLEEASDE